jgi:hypothetical protein
MNDILKELFLRNINTIFVVSFRAILTAFLGFLVWFFQDLYGRLNDIESKITDVKVQVASISKHQEINDTEQKEIKQSINVIQHDIYIIKKKIR